MVTAIINVGSTRAGTDNHPATRSRRPSPRTAWAGAVLASLLVRCASDAPTSESLLVVPGYYDTLDCRELVERVQKSTARAKELEKLRERSAASAGGSVINVFAYDTEFAKARAEQRNATEAAGRKGCDVSAQPKPQPVREGGPPAPPKPAH